jgi:Yip1-like protein
VGAAVQDAVIRYLCGLAGVFLLGVALELVAPIFSGQANRVQGMKVAAYASTPAWLFGVLAVVPRLGRYSIVGALWTLYLVYSGAPLLMKVPTERAAVFGIVAAAAAAVIGLLLEGLRLLT